MKSNMFSHHHTHTGVKQTSTGIQSGMGSREFPQRMIRYPSKVTFYVFSLSRSRMDSISEIWFYRLRFCFGWQVRCCVLCVSGEKCPSVSQTVETRALKADKEVKDKKKANRTDWLTSPFPPGLVVGLHGLGCQWMRCLLCARPLYRCHLSRKQRHNSWVNCPSSSPTPRFTSLNPTHTHIQSRSVTTVKILTQTADKHKNTVSVSSRQNKLPGGLVWGFVSRMELCDLLLSTEVQSRLLHCTAGWNTSTVGVVYVCGLVFTASERVFFFLWCRAESEESRGGLDGILVTCSCHWLHFVAPFASPLLEAKAGRRGGGNKKRGRKSAREGEERGIRRDLLLQWDWLHFVVFTPSPPQTNRPRSGSKHPQLRRRIGFYNVLPWTF